MEQIITGLVNAGGLGLLAAVLLWLHSKTLERSETAQQKTLDRFDTIINRTVEAFVKELAAERALQQSTNQDHAEDRQRKYEATTAEVQRSRDQIAHEVRRIGHTVRAIADRGCARQIPDLDVEHPK